MLILIRFTVLILCPMTDLYVMMLLPIEQAAGVVHIMAAL